MRPAGLDGAARHEWQEFAGSCLWPTGWSRPKVDSQVVGIKPATRFHLIASAAATSRGRALWQVVCVSIINNEGDADPIEEGHIRILCNL